MRVLIAIFCLLLGATLFIHHEYPDWLADHLPSPTNQSAHYRAIPPLAETSPWIAGYGRVEPVGKERRLAFEISGLIENVGVEEGDTVVPGEVVATLCDEEQRAALTTAEAESNSAKARYEKLLAGARKEVKSEAHSAVQRYQSVMENAQREMRRRQQLLAQSLIAKEDVDRSVVEYRVAQKEYEEAVQRHLIAKNSTRKEDLAQAWAEYRASLEHVQEARAVLEKTRLKSPVAGKVLKVYRHAGENVSIFFECPVATVADTGRFQVRAEVDERYAARVAAGQAAYFVAEAHDGRRFEGTVQRVGLLVGPRSIDIDKPQAREDTKTLEVILRLDFPDSLLTGETGDVFIRTERLSSSLKSAVVDQLHQAAQGKKQ